METCFTVRSNHNAILFHSYVSTKPVFFHTSFAIGSLANSRLVATVLTVYLFGSGVHFQSQTPVAPTCHVLVPIIE